MAFVFSAWVVSVGWTSKRLPGVEFRQAQTALSALFIKREGNFSLAYPTPVLGKPWSIPMEFPLYQWIVVGTSHVTGWNLTKAGRAVSIACFYLTLPAVWLLLARLEVPRARRWGVLALFLTSPFLLFYARAFLIETMAVMAAVWFCVAYERTVSTRRLGWLALAMLSGGVAALVKVTTLLLVLLPLAGWSVVRLWQRRSDWVREVAWMAASVGVPVVLAAWWTRHADAVKALNSEAWFLSSGHLAGFNLGTWETRLSLELWAMKARIVGEELTDWRMAVAVLGLGLLGARRWWRAALGCLAVFVAALALFPELYALHDYYFVANVPWLLLAVGLAWVAVAETTRPALAAALLVTLLAAQVHFYGQRYFPEQSLVSKTGDTLSVILKLSTDPDDVIVVTGQDWNAMTPYYAERRALMLRRQTLNDPDQTRRALAALRDEKIGALVVGPDDGERVWLVEALTAQGLDPQPVLRWQGYTIYLRRERLALSLGNLGAQVRGEVELLSGRTWSDAEMAPGDNLGGRWVELSELNPNQATLFAGMEPRPTRVFAQFGVSVERAGGRMDFSAHPELRLVFALPAGRHTLRTRGFFSAGAMDPDPVTGELTDGVQVELRTGSGEKSRVWFDRVIDPVRNLGHRSKVGLSIPFELAQAGEAELRIGPGAAGRLGRDWFWLERLRIESVPASTR